MLASTVVKRALAAVAVLVALVLTTGFQGQAPSTGPIPVTGTSSTLLAYLPSAAAITGTGAAANVYTYALPGGALGINKCARFTAYFNHNSGSASVSYQWNFGNVAPTAFASTGAGLFTANLVVCNNAASNVQDVIGPAALTNGGGIANSATYNVGAVDSTAQVTVTFTFNVAATDTVAPRGFLVELLK